MSSERLSIVAGQSIKGGLTAKQEGFAQGVARGLTLSDAYRMAYDAEKMKDATIWTEASSLVDNPKVATRVSSLQKAQEETASEIEKELMKRLDEFNGGTAKASG